MTLVSLNATVKKLITLDFVYDDPTKNYSIDLVGDKVYDVYFAYEGEYHKGSGKIKDVIIDDNGNFTLVLDCSTNYNSNVLHIRQDMIRVVEEGTPVITIVPQPPIEEEEGEF